MAGRFGLSFTADEIEDFLDKARGILESGELTLGPYGELLERRFAELVGVRFAITSNSGATALEIIFRHLEVAQRKVLVPSNTNFATAAAAVYAGAKIEFYDSGLFASVANIEPKLDGSVAAVVIVHIGGFISPEIRDIVRLCKAHAVPLVEDAAHAHGALADGQMAGTFGQAAAFSFYPSKNITTGEGGIIATNDEQLDVVARSLRDHGKSFDKLSNERWGNSWRMTELGAAVGVVQLERFDEHQERRRSTMRRYMDELADIPRIRFPKVPVCDLPSGYKTIALLDDPADREGLRDTLQETGVPLAKEVYPWPLYRQPVFADFRPAGALDEADAFCESHVCLPSWKGMTDHNVTMTIDGIRAYFTKNSRQ